VSDVDTGQKSCPAFVYIQAKMYNACLRFPSFLYFLTVQKMHLYFAVIDNHDFILTASSLRGNFFLYLQPYLNFLFLDYSLLIYDCRRYVCLGLLRT